MKILIFLLMPMLLWVYDCEGRDRLNSLEELKWQNRIFIINNANESIVSELKSNETGIEERHVYWFCVVADAVVTNYPGDIGTKFINHLKTEYFDKYDHPVILIGKDGGVKSVDDKLNINDYFNQIDAMPMRQSEMRE